MPATPVNPLAPFKDRMSAAMGLLLTERDAVPDIFPYPRSTALCHFLEAWENEADDDPLWEAVAQLCGVGRDCFDDDLRRAIVDLLAAVEVADGEVHTDRRPLTVRTYEQLREAHAAIGAALDAVHDREEASLQHA